MTLKQVAQEAGVSDTTVARVIDKYPHISEDVEKKVRAAMDKVSYTPRRRHKKRKIHTGYVSLLLMKWSREYLKQPLMAQIMAGVEKNLAENDMQLVLTQAVDPGKLPPMVTPERLDGVLVMGQASVQIQPALQKLNAILMLGGPHYPGNDYWADGIGSDYSACGIMAAEYLIKKGHTRLAYIEPTANHGGYQEIGWSFRAAAQRHGLNPLTLTSELTTNEAGIWDRSLVRETINELISALAKLPEDERPTGMHVPSDEITVFVYNALLANDLTPGADIEIISRRNQEMFLSQLNPRPATLDLDADEMARRAVEKLLYRIERPKAPQGARELVPPKIIEPE